MNRKQDQAVILRQGRSKGEYLLDGKVIAIPDGWVFVPSGDAFLTRRLKAASECWSVVRQRRNRLESIGLWTDGAAANHVRTVLEKERSDPAYLRRLAASRAARAREEFAYQEEFFRAVRGFLGFADSFSALERKMAFAVTEHAIPVGSGTVARTTRIPVEQRAESAVIAWMRHNTTSYDQMSIARVKGERRDVRRRLAARSREVLAKYRAGRADALAECPLYAALEKTDDSGCKFK